MSPEDQITDLVRRMNSIEEQRKIASDNVQKISNSSADVAKAHQSNLNTLRGVLQNISDRIAVIEAKLGIVQPAPAAEATPPAQ